jgi:hypothetical protein
MIRFPKDGPVEPVSEAWPRTQSEQDVRIVERFAATLAEWRGRHLGDIRALPNQAAHDVMATEDGTPIEIQVTELVTRDVLTNYEDGHVGWRVGDFDTLLLERIQDKIRRYPKQQVRLMLLVYSVDPGASEFCEFGRNDPETGKQELVVPEPLLRARSHLAEQGAGPFDEVWYAAPSPDRAQISPVFPPSLYE